MNDMPRVTRPTHHVIGDQLYIVLAQASQRAARDLHQRLEVRAEVTAEREQPQQAT